MKPSELFFFKDKKFRCVIIFPKACNKKSSGQMRQISRRMEIIHTKIGWRRDEHGTHKHAHGSWILWSVSRVRSKTMHSLSCITSWLPYITLCYLDWRFFLPREQSRTAPLGCSLAINITRQQHHNRFSSKSNFRPYEHFLWKCFSLQIL